MYPALPYLGLISVGATRQASSYSFVYPPSIIMIGILINCIAGIFLVLTGGLVIVLVLTIQQQQRHRPRRKIQMAMTDTRANSLCLKTQLLHQLNGDNRAATRLLNHAKQQNPGRSETWYLEKVIFDLERDRH